MHKLPAADNKVVSGRILTLSPSLLQERFLLDVANLAYLLFVSVSCGNIYLS